MKLSKSDIAFTAIALLVAVFLLTLLYRDINRSLNTGDRKPIGKIVFKERIAQRKLSREAIWERLQTESPVFNRDTIRTENLSEAEIVLNDGSRIALEENTLIVLNFANNEALLEFSYGGIRAATDDSNLKVRSGETVVDLRSAEARLSSDSADALQLEVTNGKALLEQGGQNREVSENEMAQVEGSEISTTEIGALLIEPANGERRITTKEREPVQFRWQADGQTRFELSKSRDFRSPMLSRPASASITVPLSPGLYYWRVVSDNDQPAQVRSFTVIKKESVALHWPQQNSVLPVRQATTPVQFSWAPLDLASSYRVVVSRDREGSDIIRQESVQTTLLAMSLPPGKYYWKVIPLSPLPEAVSASPPRPFTVERLQKLPPPIPVAPAGATFLQKIVAREGLVFTWKSFVAGGNYTVQVAADPAFKETIVSQRVSVQSFLLKKDLPERTYYWRVLTDSGIPSGVLSFSIRNKTEVTAIYPVANRSVLLEPGKTVPMRWQATSGISGRYRLIISTTADLKNPVVDRSSLSETSPVRLDPGRYYWKVLQLGADGEILGQSQTEPFTVALRPPRVTPLLPAAQTRVDMTDRNSILFRWQPTADAVRYRFRLYREPGHRRIFEQVTPANQLLFRRLDLLDTGRFSWSVTVLTRTTTVESEEAVVPFRIVIDQGQKPEFLSPDTIFVE